jgi:hypothetical protein
MQVWVLDALPGDVRAGEAGGQDHPADLIERLQQLPIPIANRTALQNYLTQHGFSLHVARWTSTNLRPLDGDPRYTDLHCVCMTSAMLKSRSAGSLRALMLSIQYLSLSRTVLVCLGVYISNSNDLER